MTLESQVVSLELAKKLKELGVKQESLFWWTRSKLKSSRIYRNHLLYGLPGYTTNPDTASSYESLESYSAFSVAELGELLPHKITTEGGDNYELYQTWMKPGWGLAYFHEDFDGSDYEEGDGTQLFQVFSVKEADARAQALIWLRKQTY